MKSVPARAQGTTLRDVRKPSSLARFRRRPARRGSLLVALVAVLLLAWVCVVANRVSEPFARLFDGDASLRALAARTAVLERRADELQQTVDALRAETRDDDAFTTL